MIVIKSRRGRDWDVFNFHSTSSNLDRIKHNWPLFAISRIAVLRARMVMAQTTRGSRGVSLCKCTRKPGPRSTHPLSARPAPPAHPRAYKTFTATIYLFYYRRSRSTAAGGSPSKPHHALLSVPTLVFIVIGKGIHLAGEHNHAFCVHLNSQYAIYLSNSGI